MVDRDAFKTLDVALRVGELLLANGAGAADVTATMQAVTRACGLHGVSVDVTFTELTLNHQPTHDDPGLVQKRSVRHREIDYEDLTLVDHIVRALLAGDIDRDDARARLARLNAHGHRRPAWAVTLGWGVWWPAPPRSSAAASSWAPSRSSPPWASTGSSGRCRPATCRRSTSRSPAGCWPASWPSARSRWDCR